jgi:hypothetical protein
MTLDNYPELLKSLNKVQTEFSDFKELKYCVRTKHSPDMPLQHPRMNCSFLEEKECSFHPAHIRYLEANSMKRLWNYYRHNTGFLLKFRCVLFDENGMSVAEQLDFIKAGKALDKQELAQFKKDIKILESIKDQVLPEVFADIDYELEESEHYVNLRIIDEPDGKLDRKTETGYKVYVNQSSVGDSGDSWAGTVCIELPSDKYLIWDFWM